MTASHRQQIGDLECLTLKINREVDVAETNKCEQSAISANKLDHISQTNECKQPAIPANTFDQTSKTNNSMTIQHIDARFMSYLCCIASCAKHDDAAIQTSQIATS
jgi:hypothetical protein